MIDSGAQGLIQTFMSSGPPQDHQLQGIWWSYNFFNGPDNNEACNLEIFFFTRMMCCHIINFVRRNMDDNRSRPQECMPLMITNTCFVP